MNFKYAVYFIAIFLYLNTPGNADKSDWPCEGHDVEGTHYQSDEKTINQETVGKLFVKWFKGGAAVLASPSVYGNKIFYGDSQGMSHCVYAEDGAEVWNVKVGVKNITSCPALIEDVMFTTCPVTSTTHNKDISNLVAVKRKTGKPVWQAYAEGGNIIPQFEQAPMMAEDIIILGTSSLEAYDKKSEFQFEGGIYAFDIEAGFLKWRYFLTDKVSGEGGGVGVCSAAALDQKLGYAYVATGHSYEEPASDKSCALICLNYKTDKRDGEKIWSYQFDDRGIWSSKNPRGNFWGISGIPLIFKGGSNRLVGICDNKFTFHAFDRKTGKLNWSSSFLPKDEKAFPMGPSGAAYDGDMLYAAANALSNENFAAQTFIKPVTKEKEVNLLRALSQDVKSTITAVKAKSGSILWQKTFDSAVLGNPSVANNLVFIGFFNGYFRVLEAKTGKILYEFRTGPVSGEYGLPPYNLNVPLTSTPVISHGRVFIAGGYVFPQDPMKVILGGLFAFEVPKENLN